MNIIRKRLHSAPARPLTDYENFKKTPIYSFLREIHILTNPYFRQDVLVTEIFHRGEEKVIFIEHLLKLLETLIDMYHIPVQDKSYRQEFLVNY
jgi:hypothetical protein